MAAEVRRVGGAAYVLGRHLTLDRHRPATTLMAAAAAYVREGGIARGRSSGGRRDVFTR
jgi:hypothetical protein